MQGGGYCFTHNPTTRKQHQAAARKGGSSALLMKGTTVLPPLNLATARDIATMLSDTINRVRVVNENGSMTIPVANAIGHLSGKLLEAYKVADLEARIEKLEASKL